MSDTDGPPTCKLSAIDPDRYDDADPEIRRRAEDLRWRLRQLENDGRVRVERTDDGGVIHEHARGAMYQSPQDRSPSDDHSRLFDECQYWAGRSGFSLDPAFGKRSIGTGPDRAVMPEVILLVYDGDVVRWNLAGVFPCVHEETSAVIAPEDFLATVEDGGDWRPDGPDLLETAHEDRREAITAHLTEHPEAIGERWVYADADVDVDVEGTIDLVFAHEREDRFALLTVKPDPRDREALDRAFGELLRYRRGFNDATPEATMDAIDLVIAGPSFPEIYEWIVRDADVRLVTVDPP